MYAGFLLVWSQSAVVQLFAVVEVPSEPEEHSGNHGASVR